MKANQFIRYNLLLSLLLLATTAWTSTLEEKTRTIEKTYPVDGQTAFRIKNQFGKVHVDTWEQNQLSVKVEIVVNGRTEQKAQALLDKIDVRIQEGSLISFETILESNLNTKGDESFEINYTIKAPAGNALTVDNKFGDTYIAGRSGATELKIAYGNVKVDEITSMMNLDLSFGKGTVGPINSGRVEVSYSDLDMTSGNQMTMVQKFSNVKIGSANELTLESKYGDMDLGKVGKLKTEAQFSGFRMAELTGSLVMEASYVSGFTINLLRASFTEVNITGKFSDYKINLEEGLKADLEADFSFADLHYSTNQIDMYYKEEDGNKSQYKGRMGGGDPVKKIKVRSSYGDLTIR